METSVENFKKQFYAIKKLLERIPLPVKFKLLRLFNGTERVEQFLKYSWGEQGPIHLQLSPLPAAHARSTEDPQGDGYLECSLHLAGLSLAPSCCWAWSPGPLLVLSYQELPNLAACEDQMVMAVKPLGGMDAAHVKWCGCGACQVIK